MKDRIEAAVSLISEAEIAMAKCRAIFAQLNMETASALSTPPLRGTIQMPVAALHDDPPSRPA